MLNIFLFMEEKQIPYRLITGDPASFSDITGVMSAASPLSPALGENYVYLAAPGESPLSGSLPVQSGVIIYPAEACPSLDSSHNPEWTCCQIQLLDSSYTVQILETLLLQEFHRLSVRQEELLRSEYIDLVSMVSRGASLHELEQFGRRLLQNPLMITDESFMLLAYTQNQEVDDPIWNEIVNTSYSPMKLVNQTDVNAFWDRLENSSIPLFVDDEAFRGCNKRVVARIKIGSKTKGYIALLEIEKKITSLDLYVLQMLAEVCAVKISESNTISAAVGQMKSEFTKDLLLGNMQSEAMIHNRAESMHLQFRQQNAVAGVCGEDNRIYIGRYLDDLRQFFLRTADLCIYTFDGTTGYFILSFRSQKAYQNLLSDAMDHYMETHQMLCALSHPVEGLSALALAFQEARRLCGLFPHLRRITPRHLYPYERYMPNLLLEHAYNRDDRQLYRCQSFEILLETDLHEKSSYIDTLRCYFRHNQNVGETANSLYVHRNTINYRLNKIRELLEEDFDDSQVRLNLQLSIISYDMKL
ncbi:PucR family transcriptional regulator [Diplocloster modestus]|uniref:Helix-turn-helix domain-containing protein n=1 Tax=Diplocloster modestus TaxID=2850322 RepID=A0ABS6KCT6_9FIRM|nr:helix-turn-helix domain-containing protein [Diplocloster modestus]MBU9728324.1 helix-turn-helix domain-containing protein [Diplocloster modestus]